MENKGIMIDFLDRIDERATFDRLLNKEESAFAIVYGRRRIGKSALLKNVIADKGIYFLADFTEKSMQINMLAKAIANFIPDFDQVIYPTWESILRALDNSTKTRITLVLDEFPYMVHAAPELPSVIQKIVDLELKKNYNLVLCGSSQQMMRELFLGTTSPLYGRADSVLNISAMKIFWLKEYLNCSAIEAVKEYATWGGVPRYWEIRKNYNSYEEAIHYAVFDKNGILAEEPMRLFLDDMRSAVQAYSIVNLVGNGNHRISEIANKLEKPTTHFSRPMSNLIEMGYLRKEVPFGEQEKDSKKSLYWISDPFLNFYMQFVASNKSMIEMGLWSVIKKQLDIKIPHLYANVWEELVRNAIPYSSIGGIDWSMAYRYWGKPDKVNEIEIDVLAESYDKKSLLIGEVKWSSSVKISEILAGLRYKLAILGIANRYESIHIAIFVMDKSAIKKEDSIYILDCEDVVSILK
ncbi:MAG: ATP-binding protein [Bacteroidetes bacterium]|nr:MAG: ATP-binding protein [Bacteroidota bacterium]